MIQFQRHAEVKIDFQPQAIIWRPVEYFCPQPQLCKDEFDDFRFAAFAIGNELSFELRAYRGERKFTSTVYLAFGDIEVNKISSALASVMKALNIPSTAKAWVRGEEFIYGQLPRSPLDRLYELEARDLVLKIISKAPKRSATISYVKKEIPKIYEPSQADKAHRLSRGLEPMWRQIVGNVNRLTRTGIVAKGYVERREGELALTPAGADYLNSIGWAID